MRIIRVIMTPPGVKRKADYSKATVPCASASNGARPLAGSPSMRTVPGIRTLNTRALNAVPLPLG